MWADSTGAGGVTATVDYQGRVDRQNASTGQRTADGVTQYAVDDKGLGAVTSNLAEAYKTYGPASLCLSAEQLIANQAIATAPSS